MALQMSKLNHRPSNSLGTSILQPVRCLPRRAWSYSVVIVTALNQQSKPPLKREVDAVGTRSVVSQTACPQRIAPSLLRQPGAAFLLVRWLARRDRDWAGGRRGAGELQKERRERCQYLLLISMRSKQKCRRRTEE